MKKKSIRMHYIVLITLLLIAPLCLSAGNKKKPPEQFCALSFVILKDSNSKPIKNASVVIHFLRKDGSQDSEGFQLKTDNDGKAHMDDMPYGRLRLQVVANSLQTYGDDVEVNQPQQVFVIRLKPPASQVSIY